MIRLRLATTIALASLLTTASTVAQAQSIVDSATTQDQRTVGAVFDRYGDAAAVGSSLEDDYDRILTGSSAQISESAQSMLPTTAYNMTGVANALTSSEERHIMGRLKSLRHKADLAPRRVPSSHAPVVYPLQTTKDSLHDLRGESKAPTASSPHGTTINYRVYSPALYKDMPTQTPPYNPNMAERAYDETMRRVTIGAGAPNEYERELEPKSRLRIVPNMADRVTTKALAFAGDAGGQSQVAATAIGGMPRRTAVLAREADRAAARSYRGQPLSSVAAYNQEIPVPATMQPSAPSSLQQPTPLTGSAGPMVMASPAPAVDVAPMSASKPVIYGPGETPSYSNEVKAPSVPLPQASDAPFVYKKLDQGSTLTTPHLGSPSRARTTLSIRQDNAYAIASSPETNVVARVPFRKPSEAGTLLWVDDKEGQASTQSTPEMQEAPAAQAETPLLAQSPEELEAKANAVYGNQAIPIRESAPINADQRWGFFISGDAGFGSDQIQTTADKSKTNIAGFTVGADYRLQDKSYLGLALTYAHTNFTTGSLGDLQSNSAALSLYGTTQYATNAYVDGYISAGYHSMESERTIFAGAGTTQKAKGSPDGFQFNGKVETGYEMKQQAWTFGPFGGFRFAYADFGSFTEKDAGNFNLKVKGLNNLSAIASLGVDGSHRYVMSNGGVLMPAVRFGYNHEFGDDRSNIKAEFVNLAGSGFSTKSDKRSRDWVNLTPSITASLPNDWTFVAQYEHDFFRDDVNENIFNLAAHYAW